VNVLPDWGEAIWTARDLREPPSVFDVDEIAGGCRYCGAHRTIEYDGLHLTGTTHHDADCPMFAFMIANHATSVGR
jgi:hypothetical protein